MINISSLAFHYPEHTPLFENFNLRIQHGETWAILGPSGCGKTTLLYLLAGLRLPDCGHIEIDGEVLTRPRPRSGLILQDYGLLPWETVRDNVELGLRVRKFYGADGKHSPLDFQPDKGIPYWLERLGIDKVADKYPAQISGGQRQRAAIARTLVLSPNLLLMDEPFSSLDAVTREDSQSLTLELCREQGITLVIVTHAIEEAAIMGQTILLLGAPPNRKPMVFENPHAGKKVVRNIAEWRDLCDRLWQEMQRQAATIQQQAGDT
ncbi:MAG: ATP-binding cassette domain-containing protein [Anaerolineales bacterium]|nr:MAG: ATP-binding cassette domain-containing protein [Anaerolineales bacterium]